MNEEVNFNFGLLHTDSQMYDMCADWSKEKQGEIDRSPGLKDIFLFRFKELKVLDYE